MSKYTIKPQRHRSSSPRSSKRGCLCRDGSYSRKCCDGEYYSQGIGKV
mgnify:CR=1 FL=1|tara:strand:+ start:11196 stop:11339 length:144 start_codon:yes stop_codon:yes gene_type:complete